MSVVRANNSHQSFKPIPEDTVCQPRQPHQPHQPHPGRNPTEQEDTDPVPPSAAHTSPTHDGSSTPETQILELRKLLTDWQDDDHKGRGGGEGGGGGGYVSGGGGSRPSSRCSVRSSSCSRQGSRFGSRRSSWVHSEDEDEAEMQVTASQKAHLLVASQQRLVYTLQGLRHELSSLDEEVNRIRNDILNNRRFSNAMRGVHEQPTWGSGYRRSNSSNNHHSNHVGSGSSSPSMYNSLDNSYSDDTDSLARSESCSSFVSWRSEAELLNVFREAEVAAASDWTSGKSSTSTNSRSDNNSSSSSNDTTSNSSGGSHGSICVQKDISTSSSSNSPGVPIIRGRYRQLGTSHGPPRR